MRAAQQHRIANRDRMPRCGLDNRVLPDHAFRSDSDRRTFCCDDGTKRHLRSGSDDDIAAEDRVWRNVGCGVDPWPFAVVFNQHLRLLVIWCKYYKELECGLVMARSSHQRFPWPFHIRRTQ